MNPRGVFFTGTSTGVGKTFVTRGLARALSRTGMRVAAIKPIETGCENGAQDAWLLARACGMLALADDPLFYRVALPVAPYAAHLEGLGPVSPFEPLVARIKTRVADADVVLVEGAGGPFVPLDRERDMLDLAQALAFPLILVAPDRLGVLSDVLGTRKALEARGAHLHAVVLTRHGDIDPSQRTNARILEERLTEKVVLFARTDDDDNALADAAVKSALLDEVVRSLTLVNDH